MEEWVQASLTIGHFNSFCWFMLVEIWLYKDDRGLNVRTNQQNGGNHQHGVILPVETKGLNQH